MYYLKKLLAALFLLACLLWFLHDFRQNRQESVITGVVVNCGLTDAASHFLTDGYLDYLHPGSRTKNARAVVDQEFIEFYGSETQLDQSRKQMALVSQAASGMIDYLIVDGDGLRALAAAGIFVEPSDVLPESLLLAQQLRIVSVPTDASNDFSDDSNDCSNDSADDSADDDSAAVSAISLAGTAFAERGLLAHEESFLVFTCTEERYAAAQQFAVYILADFS